MKSKESIVAKQVRLNQWAEQIRECNSRPKCFLQPLNTFWYFNCTINSPKGMSVDGWCVYEQNKPDRVYLFGAGRIGQATVDSLQKESRNKWKIEGFLDNSKEKHLTRIKGIPIYYPQDLLLLEKEADYKIMITMKDKESCLQQLQQLGLMEFVIL